jgi:hypothetical protein
VKVRLNFSIPVQLYDRLRAYCVGGGRTPTDLIRQLILEFLDGETPLPDVTPWEGPEKRTSVFLPNEVLLGFGAISESYMVSKSRIVAGLVLFYLERRGNVGSDVSGVSSPDYKTVLEELVAEILDTPVGWRIEELPPALSRAVEILNVKTEELPSGC